MTSRLLSHAVIISAALVALPAVANQDRAFAAGLEWGLPYAEQPVAAAQAKPSSSAFATWLEWGLPQGGQAATTSDARSGVAGPVRLEKALAEQDAGIASEITHPY